MADEKKNKQDEQAAKQKLNDEELDKVTGGKILKQKQEVDGEKNGYIFHHHVMQSWEKII